jgi:hypothetical protein
MEKLTFSQRVTRMLAVAKDLADACSLLEAVLEAVREEATAMKAAEQRFAKKPGKRGQITN